MGVLIWERNCYFWLLLDNAETNNNFVGLQTNFTWLFKMWLKINVQLLSFYKLIAELEVVVITNQQRKTSLRTDKPSYLLVVIDKNNTIMIIYT